MKILIFLVFLAVVIAGNYYFIFSKGKWESDNPLTSVFNTENRKFMDELSMKDVQKVVFYTLPDNALRPLNNGKVFCSSKIYGFDKDMEKYLMNVYLYAYCGEYYLKNDKPELGEEISQLLKVVYKVDDKKLLFDSINIANNTSNKNEYSEAIPEKFRSTIPENEERDKLTPSPKTQAENYFSGRLEVYF